jgi:hypothetical protein
LSCYKLLKNLPASFYFTGDLRGSKLPSQAGCVYYLHPVLCQAFLQFNLNLFLTDVAR